MQKNKIHLGDCLDLMQQIPSNSIDMILSDLPYGVTQCKWDVIMPLPALWEQYERIIKPNGAIALTAIEPFASQLRLSNLKNYKYDWVWNKVKGMGFLNAKRQPLRSHELVLVFYRKQCTYNPQKTTGHNKKVSLRRSHLQTEVYGEMKNDYRYESTERYPKSIQTFSMDTQSSSLHPTQKPVALFEYLVRTYTNQGETVLDNCAGSGTTAIACINSGRNFICIEKDEDIHRVACDRVERHTRNLTGLNAKEEKEGREQLLQLPK